MHDRDVELCFEGHRWLDYSKPKRSGNMEAKKDVTIKPAALGTGQKTGLKHGLGIGKMQLKHMTPGIQIKSHGKGMVGCIRHRFIEAMEILDIQCNPIGRSPE